MSLRMFTPKEREIVRLLSQDGWGLLHWTPQGNWTLVDPHGESTNIDVELVSFLHREGLIHPVITTYLLTPDGLNKIEQETN